MEQILHYVIIGIVIFDFIVERSLEYLNLKHFSESLPKELSAFYDEQSYRKSQNYLKANSRIGLLSSGLSFVILMIFLIFNGFEWIDQLVIHWSGNEYLRSLLFFGILAMGMRVISLPFDLYQTFVIEESFGFNRSSLKTFVTDKIKSTLISGIVGGLLLFFIQWAYQTGGTYFWLFTMGGLSVFTIFIAMFYTSLIVPLFNKLTPLPEGELKKAIENFASKAGYSNLRIFMIDGSRRSTKANAYFSGLGPQKKIILYDTLINDLNTEEIVAVLAHEIGHYQRRHIYKGLLLSLLQIALSLILLWFALGEPALSKALGSTISSFYMGLLSFSLLYSPLSFLISIPMQMSSRKHEYEADHFAVKNGYGQKLTDALMKLSVKSLSNLKPHPLYVFFYYSHPTLLQRKQAIEQNMQASI
jgi:STE24 endopeptidase